jgi:hypothetical protein
LSSAAPSAEKAGRFAFSSVLFDKKWNLSRLPVLLLGAMGVRLLLASKPRFPAGAPMPALADPDVTIRRPYPEQSKGFIDDAQGRSR